MKISKKQRAAKHEIENAEMSLVKESDSEVADPENSTFEHKNNLESDFQVQTKVFLENLEQTYNNGVREITAQYAKLKMKIRPEILNLTWAEYLELRNKSVVKKSSVDTANLTYLKVPATEANQTRVQSPNVSSSVPRISSQTSAENQVFGSTFTTKGCSTGKNVTTTEPIGGGENHFQVAVQKSIPFKHQNPQVILAKFDQKETPNPMRWANINELAVSMKGSPLAVSGMSRVPMIVLNVPLSNGQVMAILPKSITQKECIEVTPEVYAQLNCMEENIGYIKKMCRPKRARSNNRLKSITNSPYSKENGGK